MVFAPAEGHISVRVDHLGARETEVLVDDVVRHVRRVGEQTEWEALAIAPVKQGSHRVAVRWRTPGTTDRAVDLANAPGVKATFDYKKPL
jgi:hypothetical protein